MPPDSSPEISVVLALRDPRRVAPLLEALAPQATAPGHIEAVVVIDGEAATPPVAAPGISLRWVARPRSGLASGKGLGVLLARAPLVLLLDEGAIPAPDLLQQHLQFHRDQPMETAAAVGRLVPDPRHLTQPLVRHLLPDPDGPYAQPLPGPGASLRLGHFSAKRSFLVSLGLPDPRLEGRMAEIDLQRRLLPHSLVLHGLPAAEARLDLLPTLDAICRDRVAQGRAWGRFLAYHPTTDNLQAIDTPGLLAEWASRGWQFHPLMRLAAQFTQATGPEMSMPRRNAGALKDLAGLYATLFRLCVAKGLAESLGRIGATALSPHQPARLSRPSPPCKR